MDGAFRASIFVTCYSSPHSLICFGVESHTERESLPILILDSGFCMSSCCSKAMSNALAYVSLVKETLKDSPDMIASFYSVMKDLNEKRCGARGGRFFSALSPLFSLQT